MMKQSNDEQKKNKWKKYMGRIVWVLMALTVVMLGVMLIVMPDKKMGINQIDIGQISLEKGELTFDKMVTLQETEFRYYYEQLDEEQKAAYDTIYAGIKQWDKDINIGSITEDELEHIYYCILFDNPDLIQLPNKFIYKKSEDDNLLRINYRMRKKDYQMQASALNAEIEKVVKETEGMDDFSKEMYVYDYLLDKCEYCTMSIVDGDNIYSSIIIGGAKCRGYSAAFSYLLNCCGVKSGQIIGEAGDKKKDTHSWNFVILEDEIYYCDVCWDDISDKTVGNQLPSCYLFFNMTYEDISRTHTQGLQEKYLFTIDKENSGKYSYMKQNGLYASNYNEVYDIIMSKLEFAKSSKNPLMIQCKNKEDYETLSDNLEEIITDIKNRLDLDITNCQYIKVPNGNAIIIYNLS